ncbi:MAG: hypothetical protein IJ391_08510 [Clostridia bacterium]|nr:hypothetical protein [Clostridia bacterium]
MITRFEQFTSVISEIYRYVKKLEREEMIKYGLKGAFAEYLVAMNRYTDGITAAKLCEICDRDKAAVSRILCEMELHGLIVRQSGYRALVTLTKEGRKAAEFVLDRACIAVAKAGTGLNDEDRKVFYDTLALISSNLQLISKEGIPQT